MRWPRFLIAAVGGTLLAILAPPAHCGVVLDQNYDPNGNSVAGFGSGNTNQERAQTFTVGVSGSLVSADVFLELFSGNQGSLVSSICQVDSQGHPSTALATIMTPASQVPAIPGGFVSLDYSSDPVPVYAGESLAILLYASSGNLTFNWFGQTPGTYAFGDEQEEVIGNHSWLVESGPFGGDFDMEFQTYVNVPEPTAGVLWLGACACLPLRRWRRPHRPDQKRTS